MRKRDLIAEIARLRLIVADLQDEIDKLLDELERGQ